MDVLYVKIDEGLSNPNKGDDFMHAGQRIQFIFEYDAVPELGIKPGETGRILETFDDYIMIVELDKKRRVLDVFENCIPMLENECSRYCLPLSD